MQYGYTIVYVPNVAAALDFYQRAFGLELRFLHESGTYGELATGATVLAFSDEAFVGELISVGFRVHRPTEPPAALEIGLVTTDMPAAFDRALAAGAQPLLVPTVKPWGQIVAYVRDLNGVLIELCTPVEVE